MGAGAVRGLAHFKDDAARARYFPAYDAVLATWPEVPSARAVPTRFGSTHVNVLERPDGSPVVLLHPLAVASVSWYASAGALAAAGHPVYAPDAITDAGRSVQTERVRTNADSATWLNDVLDGLGIERAHLVGVSFGGWLTMNQGRIAPERVASMTAIDPAGAVGRPPLPFLAAMVRGAINGRFGRSDHPLDSLLRTMHNGRLPDEPLLELSYASIRGFVPAQPIPRRFSDDELRALTPPMLFVIGGATCVTDATKAVDRVRRLVPNVEAVLIPGTGHSVTLERADQVNALILEFIARIDGSGTDR
jgi:pimeloyl-ACP methyl ester carboxylesterase